MLRKILVIILILHAITIYSREINWKYRETPYNSQLGYNFTELYLEIPDSGEKYFIYAFGKGMKVSFKDKKFKINGAQSVTSSSVWWAGLGITLSLTQKDSIISIYKTSSGCAENNVIDKSPLFSHNLKENSDVKILSPQKFEIPSYTRKLIVSNQRLYGEDIRYLQALIVFFYNIKIDIDGYFGPQSENAVKAIQKKFNLEETGIVDEELWERILDIESINMNDIMNTQ